MFKNKGYLDRLDEAIRNNKVLWFFILILISLIFMLLIGYMNLRSSLVVQITVPKTIEKSGVAVVGIGKGNPYFYEVWGLEVLRHIANYTPSGIANNYTFVKSLLDPDVMIKSGALFNKKIKGVQDRLEFQTFYLHKSRVGSNDAGVTAVYIASGVAKRKISNMVEETLYCDYRISFAVHNFTPFVTGISDKCRELNPSNKEDAKILRKNSTVKPLQQ